MNHEIEKQLSAAIALPDQPQQAFDWLAKLSDQLIGAKLFTVMANEPNEGLSERLYTNMPDAYPVSGTKPYNRTYWSQVTLEQQRTFVANTIEDIAEVFDDYKLIQSLGCESVINVPIVVGGEVIGTINCLHDKNHYSAERVEAAKQLVVPGAICLLLAKVQKEGEK